MKTYDVIVIGAGSAGVPAALALSAEGLKILVVDKRPSPGQGGNKHAIGGIRATHSEPAKVITGLRSIEIFSTWEKTHGDPVEWLRGGYTFPVYRNTEKRLLQRMLPLQQAHGLNIDFVDAGDIKDIIPGINQNGLLGGTYSPDDGTASPLMAIHAFYRGAVERGVRFHFNETVRQIWRSRDTVSGVITDKGKYAAPVVVDAAGANSGRVCETAGVDIPVSPDSHEAGITEPVKRFFNTMVVDIRPAPDSQNYYFYQNKLGQIIFCMTPDPPIKGTDTRETSSFLPQISARMIHLIPRLADIRVRRVWRGLYPMSPDGSPLVGWNREVQGLIHVTGMCGQGFMLGPGIGEIAARLITQNTTVEDETVISGFSPYRDFAGAEALK